MSLLAGELRFPYPRHDLRHHHHSAAVRGGESHGCTYGSDWHAPLRTAVELAGRSRAHIEASALDMGVMLRKRDCNVMVSKSCPDHEIELTPKHARSGDVRQSEVEAEGAGQDRHGAQVDAGRLEDHDQADGNDDIADDRAGLSTDSQIHAALGEEAGDDPDL